MAAIANILKKDTTQRTHSGTTNWQDGLTVPSGELPANGVFFFLCQAQIGGDNSNGRFGFRIVEGATPTLLVGAHSIIEPVSGTDAEKHNYSYFTKYIVPATPVDVKFQYRNEENTGDTVRVDTQVIKMMRLDVDLVEGVDWAYAEDDDTSSPTAHTTSFADFASITFTPGNTNDDWLVFGASQHQDAASLQCEYHIDFDTATSIAPEFSEEGEDTANKRCYVMQRVFTLSAASHTFKMRGRDDGSGTQGQHLRTAMFTVRLNVFEDHFFNWTETAQNPTSGVYTQATNGELNFTPSTAGDFWMLGQSIHDAGSLVFAGIRMQVGGVTVPAGRDSSTDSQAYDTNDENVMMTIDRVNLAASAQDLDFDILSEGTTPHEDRSFVAFSMELAVVAGPQFITPGSVSIAYALPTQVMAGLGVASITPGPVSIAYSLPTQVMAGSGVASIAPGAVSIAYALPTQVIAGSGVASIAPGAVTITYSLPAQVISAVGVILPGAVVITYGLPTQVIAGSGVAGITPGAVVITYGLPSQTIGGTAAAVPRPTSAPVTNAEQARAFVTNSGISQAVVTNPNKSEPEGPR